MEEGRDVVMVIGGWTQGLEGKGEEWSRQGAKRRSEHRSHRCQLDSRSALADRESLQRGVADPE